MLNFRAISALQYCIGNFFGSEQVMSHQEDLAPARYVRTTPDLPAVPKANASALPESISATMDGQLAVEWLTVQAGDMAGPFQHGVRALMSRAKPPLPELRGQADELARLRMQLQHHTRTNHEMNAKLRNQALAIDASTQVADGW